MKLTTQILRTFRDNGYVWKFKDGARLPTKDELSTTLDTAKTALLESEDQTQISIGRLIVKKDNGHYDVYTHMGEL